MFPILSLFKARKFIIPLIVVVAIGGLIFSGKNYIDNKDETITTLQSVIGSKNIEINQLNNNISIYKGQIISLQSEIADKEYQRKLAESQTENLRLKSVIVQKELRKAEKKLVGRDYNKLKESRHRELVLKIINRSVTKQLKIFEEEQPK
ncbi:MAG: hypothetical protein H8D97_00725 [Proteobacteria bacterium]|nr:hypothetical protein [Pseudomonadota bacterium]